MLLLDVMNDTTIVDEVQTAVENATTQQSINLFEMAQYGGWIMVILAILLAGACYIFIERLMVMNKATKEDTL